MNKAFELILKKIEEKRNKYQRLADGSNFDGWNEEDIKYSAKAEMCEELKEIVQEVAEEYKGGWIACSERFPDVEADVLLSLRSLDIHTGFRSNTEGYFYVDGEGYVEFENVLAWQPLPEPFKERD